MVSRSANTERIKRGRLYVKSAFRLLVGKVLSGKAGEAETIIPGLGGGSDWERREWGASLLIRPSLRP